MSVPTVTIQHDGGAAEIEDPDFVDCLFNTGQAAVDGNIYTGVTQVTYE